MDGHFTRVLRAISLVLLLAGSATAQIVQASQGVERAPPGADVYEECDAARALDFEKLESETGLFARDLARVLQDPRRFLDVLRSATTPDGYRALHDAQAQYAEFCEKEWLERHRRYQVLSAAPRRL